MLGRAQLCLKVAHRINEGGKDSVPGGQICIRKLVQCRVGMQTKRGEKRPRGRQAGIGVTQNHFPPV
ncbi:MAG: hypothetical protein QOF15_746, partial [Mycobacterium sp.]|nr:hypothetical protein [Mycobacterium sp.]